MSSPSELDQLVSEYTQMDAMTDPERAKALLLRAATLVDRDAAPKKWGAFRRLYAGLAERDDPTAAIAAYRDALSAWDPVEQRDVSIDCHLQLGCQLANAAPGTPDGEAAITHLQHAVGDHPWVARLLATLLGLRPLGDPVDNWQRRVTCLDIAVAQVNPETDLPAWAAVSNERACACQDQPGGDFAAALEERITRHHAVLDRVRAGSGSVIDTCLHLATASLDRVHGDLTASGVAAEQFVQEALAAGPDEAVKVQLLLLRGRCLTFKRHPHDAAALRAALDVFAQARALAASRSQPELRASVEKLAALAWLDLLRLGERQHLASFVACCESALALFDGPTFGSERRKLFQIQADGLLAVNDLDAAARCCAQAVALAEHGLAQATTTAGRLERVWELRDSAGLLAWCRARVGDLAAAIDVLDQGKARLWDRGGDQPASALLASLVPLNGALVLPISAGPDGIAIVVTHRDAQAVLTRVDLPGFGKTRVLELQRGASSEALGGWLHAYCYRRSEPARFRDEIVSVGEVLHREFWTPVLAELARLGLVAGAELVVFPQGASASLPMHAASWLEDGQRRWLLDSYAVRYAPSLRALAHDAGPAPAGDGVTIVAADPDGDLVFSAFEVAWIQEVLPGARVLAGADATAERVLAALHASSHVHIATHADFNLDDPFASRIRVSNGDLTVLQLVEHLAVRRPRFVALSACETGVTRVTSLSDEFLGFPVALLVAGVRTVLATQWPVDDEASALLMAEFYRFFVGGELSAAEALRRAQTRLRTLTVAELSSRLRTLRDRGDAAGELAGLLRSRLRGRDDNECPFAHPYFWAGFCIVGAH